MNIRSFYSNLHIIQASTLKYQKFGIYFGEEEGIYIKLLPESSPSDRIPKE